MKYCVFSENEWVYPDSELGGETTARLFAARGGDVNFQILTDKTFAGGEAVAVAFSAAGCGTEVYQLLTARVTENSGPKTHTTTNYDEVKDFVTRPLRSTTLPNPWRTAARSRAEPPFGCASTWRRTPPSAR